MASTAHDDKQPTVRPSGLHRIRSAPGRVHRLLEAAKALTLLAENPDERLVDFLEFRGAHLPGPINDDAGVCRKQSIGSDAADLAEPAAYKVAGVEW